MRGIYYPSSWCDPLWSVFPLFDKVQSCSWCWLTVGREKGRGIFFLWAWVAASAMRLKSWPATRWLFQDLSLLSRAQPRSRGAKDRAPRYGTKRSVLAANQKKAGHETASCMFLFRYPAVEDVTGFNLSTRVRTNEVICMAERRHSVQIIPVSSLACSGSYYNPRVHVATITGKW